MKVNWQIGDVVTAEDMNDMVSRIVGSIREVGREVLSVSASGWAVNAQGSYEKTVDCAGTIAGSSTQRINYQVQGDQLGAVLLSGCEVNANNKLTIICIAQPTAAFELGVAIEEVVQA